MSNEMQAETLDRRDRPSIEARRSNFDYRDLKPRFWYRDNSILSSLFASLSAVFPPGEKEFVRSVMQFREQIRDPELMKLVRKFAAQEGEHARQHRIANEYLDELGYRATFLSKHLDSHIQAMLKQFGDEDLLASTVGMEHITAILADYILTHPELFDGVPESARELLKWHAVEEIEHKAVAFDVYAETVGDKARLNKVFRIITWEFGLRMLAYTVAGLYWQRHIPRPKEIADTIRFLFGKDGIVTSIRGDYSDFYRSDFHPWQKDNRALLEAWKAEHQEQPVAAE
ncbi:MAG: metal-dependent hydrolase [Polyangiales bacterium]